MSTSRRPPAPRPADAHGRFLRALLASGLAHLVLIAGLGLLTSSRSLAGAMRPSRSLALARTDAEELFGAYEEPQRAVHEPTDAEVLDSVPEAEDLGWLDELNGFVEVEDAPLENPLLDADPYALLHELGEPLFPPPATEEPPTSPEPPRAEPEAAEIQPEAAENEPPATPASADAGALAAAPLLLEAPSPSYPALARRMGWTGTVRCRLLVAPDGRVVDVRIDASSGHDVLDQAAVRALLRWRFRPGALGPGRDPVAVLHLVTFKN